MQNKLVSIIIPAYNAESFLTECLDSLINQTYSELEIICVDDGSTDSTYHILETYQLKDRRIRLLRQDNQYAGAARNCGMRKAKGKYLLFVDADDFCSPDMVEKLVKKAEAENTDILVFDLYRYDARGKKIIGDSWTSIHPEYFGKGVQSALDLKDTIFQFTSSGPQNKLFLREFILGNNIWFQAIPRTNDLFFVFAAMTYAGRISVLNEKLQYYRVNNPNSLQATNKKSPLAFLDALQALKENLTGRGVYGIYERSYLKMSVAVSMYNLASQQDADTYVLTLDAIRHSALCSKTMEIHSQESDGQVKMLEQFIDQNRSIIIYGAGTIAQVLVKYLLFVKHIGKSKIQIMVTQKSGHEESLCGISVKAFSASWMEEYLSGVVIAANDVSIQSEMMGQLQSRGINKATVIGFGEMMRLLQGGESSQL